MTNRKNRTRRNRSKVQTSQRASATASSSRLLVYGDALIVLSLALLIAVSYLPATWAGFVWDDVILTGSKAVAEPAGLWQLWSVPETYDLRNTNEGHYWPIVYTTFWLEHALWGFDPTGYHIVNLLLHFANTFLLWHLMRRLAVPGAWFIAAVFAIHPVHVESVAWVMGRKDLLSAFFYLAAFLTWTRCAEEPRPRRYLFALATLVLFVAGLLSKSVVVTLPAALVIWHWWKQDRVTVTDLLRLAPLFLVAAFAAVVDTSFYAARESVAFDHSIIERVLIAARSLMFYVAKLLMPVHLAVIYPRWETGASDPLAWGCVVGVITVAGLGWFCRGRIGRGPLAGALFFAVTLSPVLGFIDFGYMQFSFVADRYQYLACIGVIAVLTAAAAHGTATLAAGQRAGLVRWARGAAQAVALVVLLALGLVTWRQANIYRDGVTFNSHIVALNPQARDAYLNLGSALFAAGRMEEALAAARLAIAQRPSSAIAHYNAGGALLRLGHLEQALTANRTALKHDPNYVKAHSNAGVALFRLGRFDEAEEHYRRALELDPNYAFALRNLIVVLIRQDRFDEAEQHLRSPQVVTGTLQMLDVEGELRLRQGRYEEAVALLRSLTEAQPDNARAHSDIGVGLYHLGRLSEALTSFQRALSLDPELETARTNLEQVRRVIEQRGP